MKSFVAIGVAFFSLSAAASDSLTVDVDPSGRYTIQSSPEALPGRFAENWIFQGHVDAPRGVALERSRGHDPIGDYEEVQFEPTGLADRYSIRVYAAFHSVVFTQQSHAVVAGGLRFPIFDRFPTTNIRQLSHQQKEFAPTILGLSGDAPWLFFAPGGSSFILSPADHFMISNCFLSGGKLSAGIEQQVRDTPDSFEHKSILSLGSGVNEAFENWGAALVRKSGKLAPANDEDAVLNTVGYWSDNRSSYWYNYDLALGYEGTLRQVHEEFLSQGIRLGHLQLDSWWYLKGGDPLANPPLPISWKRANYDHGIYLYEAAPELFPDGLPAFQESIGLPLVTHARWVDPSSPYASRYKMSDNVSVDPAYWDMIMKSLKSDGVLVYEQDWLNSKALPRLDRIADADEFLDHMSEAAARYGLGLQYCMPLARHFMQASRYSNVRTIRPSGDGFERSKWNQFLYGSRLASSLGIWPWTDVFFSADLNNVLLATLSGGIVGVGDRLNLDDKPEDDSNPGYCKSSLNCRLLQAQNLKHAIRADGVVVKPDTSLVPLDQSYTSLAGFSDSSAPMVAAAYTNAQDGSHWAAYVFAYSQKNGGQAQISIRPSDLGFSGDVYVYDYFAAKGSRVSAAGEFRANVGFQGSYFIVAPMGASGGALLGDLSLFASLGKKRVELESPSKLKVHFAPDESTLTLTAYKSGSLLRWNVKRPESSDTAQSFDLVVNVADWPTATTN